MGFKFTMGYPKNSLECAFEVLTKGGFLSEKSGGFLLLPTLQKNILFYYPKLLHPKCRFSNNLPLQVQEVGFRSTNNNFICLNYLIY